MNTLCQKMISRLTILILWNGFHNHRKRSSQHLICCPIVPRLHFVEREKYLLRKDLWWIFSKIPDFLCKKDYSRYCHYLLINFSSKFFLKNNSFDRENCSLHDYVI